MSSEENAQSGICLELCQVEFYLTAHLFVVVGAMIKWLAFIKPGNGQDAETWQRPTGGMAPDDAAKFSQNRQQLPALASERLLPIEGYGALGTPGSKVNTKGKGMGGGGQQKSLPGAQTVTCAFVSCHPQRGSTEVSPTPAAASASPGHVQGAAHPQWSAPQASAHASCVCGKDGHRGRLGPEWQACVPSMCTHTYPHVSVCVHTYRHAQIHTCLHMHTHEHASYTYTQHTCIHKHTPMYTCSHIHITQACMHIYTCAYVHACTHTQNTRTHNCMHVYTLTGIHAHMHVDTHYTSTCVCMYTHVFTHMHTTHNTGM